MTESIKHNEILIAGITPYFIERGGLWYEENFAKIKKAAQTQIWWKTNTLFLEKDLAINLFALLRQLTELGYEKTQTIGAPGEFAHRGGIVEIFPINSNNAWRLEFTGNKISDISALPVKILRTEKQIKKDLSGRQNASLLFNLHAGDYLVHIDHGVGRFAGFTNQPGDKGVRYSELKVPDTLEDNSPAKFFILEYAKGDKLYVPLDKEEKLSRYIGFEIPIVHRLGGALWLKTKRRAKENTLKLAKELLALYGQRATSRGFEYPAESSWQKELATDFPYVETDDQARAIAEVVADMESPKPMDRLICGDVGFGKTEVALRAAFKAAEAGKQVAILAPTTILANQHFHNFTQRLNKFPVRVALLTRLQSKNEQKKIIRELGEGKIDILIGTHRLLSKDIVFKNLGLAIIDEEQRFGVKQKEIFNGLRRGEFAPPLRKGGLRSLEEENLATPPFAKGGGEGFSPFSKGSTRRGRDFKSPSIPLYKGGNENHSIDILSLSATPIPRTLNLTLAGLRDISIIGTPPPGRLPIKTFVEPFNKKIIKEAIAKELARGGQVYYLHNRVETIGLAAKRLQKLLTPPFAKGGGEGFKSPLIPLYKGGNKAPAIAAIHGRLPEKELIRIMDEFEYDEKNQTSPTPVKGRARKAQWATGLYWGPHGALRPPLQVQGGRTSTPLTQRGGGGVKKPSIDILVATTIIENGLDFPNVNTLIVANATRLGLSQAYQIRGRIGRSDQQAFAYFLYNSKHLTDDAKARLDALQEAEALGSGYQVALRDLEIRGAGNVLGREQSGPVNSVGLNLYMQMLSESVEELKK